jgi:two-component system chemotaxis response regulator CheY
VSRRVLVVDDDESIRQFIEMALDDDGFEVAVAAEGASALDTAVRFRPHVILLDMRMPGVDGWSFAEAYRESPGPHAPILVLTAARDAESYAAEIGADAFLAKPFDLAELIRKLNALAAPQAANERAE